MMVEVPGVLAADEVLRCREMLEKASWQDGRHTAGKSAAGVKANQQIAQDDPVGQQLSNFILERLAQVPRFLSAALPLKILPPRFNRYTGSGSYGDHIDSAIFSVPGTPHRIRGDLSATLFFSDPSEYDGGELIVQGDFARHTVKLPAGHMILYPASTLHRVTPVTRGARFASFFWIQSLVREGNRRQMLLELDETIQSLAGETPDNPAVVRLTGLYHNLLRDWTIA
jgi:PKHD-type hydroxylase